MLVKLTNDEHGLLEAAAARRRLAVAAFVAEAALAVASGADLPGRSPLQDVLIELIQARTQAGRIGTELRQAVAALEEGDGAEGAPLGPAAEEAMRAIHRLESVAESVRKKLS